MVVVFVPILALILLEYLLFQAIGLRSKVSRTLDRLQDWIDRPSLI